MSRSMTAAQVIALGKYLEPDFDPASLTVSQLLGVLGYHNIQYPTPYNKSKLVQLFNEDIKSRATKFRKDRLKKENSIASDDGITDGLTGKLIGGPKKSTVARRTSRRLSRAPADEDEEISPIRPEPPKRRRSSAQPSLGGPSRKVAPPAQPALIEESEPEEEEMPVRKVGRSKKTSEAAGAQSRRVSGPMSPAEDSGWEDNNIFQSGAESSSPMRPSPVRRKNVAPRKSRKSMSAPPQVLLSSSPVRPRPETDGSPFSPPQSRFNPQLPADVSRETRKLAPLFAHPNFGSPSSPLAKEETEDELNIIGISSNSMVDSLQEEMIEEQVENSEVEEQAESDPETHDALVMQRISEGSPVAKRPASGEDKPSLLLRSLLVLLAVAGSTTVWNFKAESASLGYCDPGSKTNAALESLRHRRSAVEACNRENRTTLYLPPSSVGSSKEGSTVGESEGADLTPCPLPPLLPLPHADACTPCPEHATCSQYDVVCDTGYLLRPHPLLFLLPPSSSPSNTSLSLSTSPVDFVWKVISETTNGLPGFGSVALPPRCVEDPKRKRNIGVLGKAVEALLGQERGRRICAGGNEVNKIVEEKDGGDARKWGEEIEKMRDAMRKKTSPHLLATFDDTFNEAVQQLIQWGGVIFGEDQDGNRYLAHKTPDLTWNCALTVKSREIWAEWRTTVLGFVIMVVFTLFGRSRAVQKKIESKRIAELVQIALDTLRNQELAHHTDPITAPQPYLSSLQLRDLILQDEHSIPARRRLWDKVERVVEGNANVRANLEEIQGGDEMRVWRWVGSAGRGPGVRSPPRLEQGVDEL